MPNSKDNRIWTAEIEHIGTKRFRVHIFAHNNGRREFVEELMFTNTNEIDKYLSQHNKAARERLKNQPPPVPVSAPEGEFQVEGVKFVRGTPKAKKKKTRAEDQNDDGEGLLERDDFLSDLDKRRRRRQAEKDSD